MGRWVVGGGEVMGWTLGSPPLYPGSSRLPRSSLLPDGPRPAASTGPPIVPGPARLPGATILVLSPVASSAHTFLTCTIAAEIRFLPEHRNGAGQSLTPLSGSVEERLLPLLDGFDHELSRRNDMTVTPCLRTH